MFMDMMQHQYGTKLVQAFSIYKFVKNAPCSGRPITGKVDEIMEKIEQDRHIKVAVQFTLKVLKHHFILVVYQILNKDKRWS